MAINRYKLRNFDDHHDKKRFYSASDLTSGLSVSNGQYDISKGITHSYITTPTGKHLIGDVELCMSMDPSVLAIISPTEQSLLRMQITRNPPQRHSFSDDDLIASVVPTYGVERSDVDKFLSSDLLASESPTPESPTPESFDS